MTTKRILLAVVILMLTMMYLTLATKIYFGSQPKQLDNSTPTVPACASEDQEIGPCFWDAKTRGNGKGTSFLLTAEGEIYYLP